MPWPFRKRKEGSGPAAAPAPTPAAPRPITAADFAPRRVAVPTPRAWASLPPIAPSIRPVSQDLTVPAASFVADVGGTQPLIQTPVLRQVSPEGPAGRADALVAPTRPLPVLPADPGPAGPGSAQVPPPRSRPVSARPAASPAGPASRGAAPAPRRPTQRLDTYVGPLQPVEPERFDDGGWETGWYDDPEPVDDVDDGGDGIPEELPPPIFSTLLAERTG